jgi:voltage-gated potassium channel
MAGREELTLPGWREQIYVVIFEHDTPGGKLFDMALLWAILLSVLAVMLESVAWIKTDWGAELRALEWFFTAIFTVEYGLRRISVRRPARYARSFFGIVDLLAIIPTYLSLTFAGAQSLLVIRALRLLRIFRILKLGEYVSESYVLMEALRATRKKITVFLSAVLTLVLIIGAMMHLIEGEESGFTSIPESVYWAIVTMTTVGYGDIAPRTVLGQVLASALMIIGYGIIAVPTGIVSVELAQATRHSGRACRECSAEGHDRDAVHCKYCGAVLNGNG